MVRLFSNIVHQITNSSLTLDPWRLVLVVRISVKSIPKNVFHRCNYYYCKKNSLVDMCLLVATAQLTTFKIQLCMSWLTDNNQSNEQAINVWLFHSLFPLGHAIPFHRNTGSLVLVHKYIGYKYTGAPNIFDWHGSRFRFSDFENHKFLNERMADLFAALDGHIKAAAYGEVIKVADES